MSLGIKWIDGNFKTLGIWYASIESETLALNTNKHLRIIKTILNIWNTRFLTLKGKITVIKSLTMPHVTHLA